MNCDSREFMKTIFYLCLLFAVISTSSCAIKPWTAPLADQEFDEAKTLFSRVIEQQNVCGNTIAANLSLLVKTPFNKHAVAGFFQWSQPSNFRFIVSNPFGQPILVIMGNQNFFSSINTSSRAYKEGSMSSFGIRNKIPPYFLEGNWHEWITGSKSLKDNTIFEIRNSSDHKGIWVAFQDTPRGRLEHILIDRDLGKITRRLLEGPDGVTKADIYYETWSELKNCNQPSEILINGLDAGVKISFKLSEISISDEQIKMKIPIPYGFSKTYLP